MSTALSESSAESAYSTFFRSRLGSLLAVFPLGVWVFVHLWNNLSAFRALPILGLPDDGESWQQAVTEHPHPVAQALTAIVVLLPIVIHTVWGIGRMLSTRPNNLRYRYFANLKFLLQRLAAVGVLFFLGAHIWKATLEPRLIEHHREEFHDLARQLATHPPTLIVYALGTLGVAYHLANGVSTFAMGFGIATSRRGVRRADRLGIAVFLLLLAMAWGSLFALVRAATAS